MMFSTDRHGILKEIKYKGKMDEDILEISFFKYPGDEICVFENSNDCIGQVIVKGNNLESCRKKIEQVMSEIYMDLE